jgi:tripeptidyl-peptidase-1
MGPENGGSEVACEVSRSLQYRLLLSVSQSDLGGTITTGGGFSAYFAQPSYQSQAVKAYLSSPTGKAAAAGYNPQGRGYPDISFIGVDYPVIIGSKTYLMCGTSASTPVAAAMGES